jgi:hypothetical protein
MAAVFPCFLVEKCLTINPADFIYRINAVPFMSLMKVVRYWAAMLGIVCYSLIAMSFDEFSG